MMMTMRTMTDMDMGQGLTRHSVLPNPTSLHKCTVPSVLIKSHSYSSITSFYAASDFGSPPLSCFYHSWSNTCSADLSHHTVPQKKSKEFVKRATATPLSQQLREPCCFVV